MIDLEELAALESKATPAPWHRVPANKAETPFVLAHGEGDSIASFEPCGPWVSGKQAIDDLDLTVALRNAAPELIASARRVVELEKDKRELIELAQKRFEQVAALQSRLAAAEAERVVEAARKCDDR